MSDVLRAMAEGLVKASIADPEEPLTLVAIDLAHAYLAEHPADEDEPVTEKWLAQVGFVFVEAGPPKSGGWVLCLVDFEIDEERGIYGEELRLVDGDALGWHVEVRSRAEKWSRGVGLATYKTRGDVRRLCKALGIELP